MKKITLVKISLLSSILLLNSGCFFGIFGESPKPSNGQKVMPTSKLSTPSFESLTPECSDNLNAESACNKGKIKPTELKPKLTTTVGGEVHKLKSFQGQDITIVEHKNGYIFPELKNKIVILEMFGKNCSHCIKEIPIMNSLKRKYRNKLEIIAIQVDAKMSSMEAKAFIRRYHIHYPIISGDTATNLQYNIQNTYGWTGILPFIMIIKDGLTEFTHRGQVSSQELHSNLQSLIK